MVPPGFHLGRIVAKSRLSTRICGLELEVPTLSTFHPGQWVDFVVVEGEDWVGGFSLTSHPDDLPRCRLAVQYSSHAPSKWVHERAKVGDEIAIRVGGDCVLMEREEESSAAFVGGGIGMAPILSLYRQWYQRQQRLRTFMLYSVSSPSELVFGEEIRTLFRQHGHAEDRLIFASTRDPWDASIHVDDDSRICYCTGRKLDGFLRDSVDANTDVYLCGPALMLDAAEEQLRQLSVDSDRMHYEKWW